MEFVESVSRPGMSYVPPAERIATFDNDGTLWCEKPQYVQADFVFHRWKQMVEADPAKVWSSRYRASAEERPGREPAGRMSATAVRGH